MKKIPDKESTEIKKELAELRAQLESQTKPKKKEAKKETKQKIPKTMEEEFEDQYTDEELRNFRIEKKDMEQLTNRVCEIVALYGDNGMLQNELWKKLIFFLSGIVGVISVPPPNHDFEVIICLVLK